MRDNQIDIFWGIDYIGDFWSSTQSFSPTQPQSHYDVGWLFETDLNGDGADLYEEAHETQGHSVRCLKK